MRDVYIAGIGQTAATKGGEQRGRYLARAAIEAALRDAGSDPAGVGALYIGNMMSGILGRQQLLGPLVADLAGMRGVEAMTAEGACASGAAAMRLAHLAVGGGAHDMVVVCGMERMSHVPRDETTCALATAADWELEGCAGESFLSLNARLMALYMDRHGVEPVDFAPFAIAAHRNALANPHAVLHKPLDTDGYLASRIVSDPVRLMDAPPICDGAAAVVVCSEPVARALRPGAPRVRVRASAVGTDSLALANRRDPLVLDGARASSARAYEQAGVGPDDIDLFELHDAYTVISALSLEAAGFARPGEGTRLAAEGRIAPGGDVPIATMGGLKARGHPVGATGVYQLAEAYLQLSERAGGSQVPDAELAMVQNIGGTGAMVVTHILERAA